MRFFSRRWAGFDQHFSLRRHLQTVDPRLIPNGFAIFLHLEADLRFLGAHRLQEQIALSQILPIYIRKDFHLTRLTLGRASPAQRWARLLSELQIARAREGAGCNESKVWPGRRDRSKLIGLALSL